MPPLSARNPAQINHLPYREILRSEIKLADYNPRSIDPIARRKLRESIERNGLAETLIWNEQTGHLIGGHQRIDILDEMYAGTDYLVPVSVADVSPIRERELNIAMNNTTAMGDLDFAKMELMFRDQGVSPFDAGLDLLDLQSVFPTETVTELLQQYGRFDDLESLNRLAEIPGTPPPDTIQQAALDIMDIKAARKKHQSGSREDLRSDHIVVMVFDTPTQAQDWLVALNLPNQPFFMAGDVLTALGRLDSLPAIVPLASPLTL